MKNEDGFCSSEEGQTEKKIQIMLHRLKKNENKKHLAFK